MPCWQKRTVPYYLVNQPNKGRAIFRGGWGGKGTDEGEHRFNRTMHPTPSGKRMSRGWTVREGSKGKKAGAVQRFLLHISTLIYSATASTRFSVRLHPERRRNVAEMNGLEDRLVDLHSRVHRAYRAKPSRRVFIPKADGRQRPLGIAAAGGQNRSASVVTEHLNQIYEVDFQGRFYGFRPGRSPHQALDALT